MRRKCAKAIANFFLCSVNWDAIKVEISCSNVIQRDNLTFAKALDKGLMDIAKENDDVVSFLNFKGTVSPELSWVLLYLNGKPFNFIKGIPTSQFTEEDPAH